MGPCGIYKKEQVWLWDPQYGSCFLYFILNKNLVGCGVLLRDETFMAVAESAFWLESCLAPWEKEVKAFPQRKLQFPVFKVYFVNSKKTKRWRF